MRTSPEGFRSKKLSHDFTKTDEAQVEDFEKQDYAVTFRREILCLAIDESYRTPITHIKNKNSQFFMQAVETRFCVGFMFSILFINYEKYTIN